MCGIAGFVDRTATWNAEEGASLARGMASTLISRGPDDDGVWVDTSSGVALGQRRLAIVDLSPAGHQPMVSGNGRYVITYNGEVYNFDQIRDELTRFGATFRGHSDTEVVLEACAAWGIADAVARLIGMFAFALWDRQLRTLTLCRDRIGIKPLYWGCLGELFLFGSELKSLRAHPGWVPEIDRDALASFFRYNYLPSPHTIYRGVRKLEPGCVLILSEGGEPTIRTYWQLESTALAARRKHAAADDPVEALDNLLRDAVKRRMRADVPLGAFLSGGIDSSTVVALMQAQCDRPVRSFTIGFQEEDHDEAVYAKAVANHLGTDHTELYVEPSHARDLIPRMADYYDEPFADASQLPTMLLCELTRRHVTVALSGDGGDEVFGGYTRYFWADGVWRHTRWLPPGLRRALTRMLRIIPPEGWDRLFALAPSSIRPVRAGAKMQKLANLVALDSSSGFYRQLLTTWEAPESLVLGAREPQGPPWDESFGCEFANFTDRMRMIDMLTYLPENILTKVDRASMAFSLEARVPLLDHRVIAFAWGLEPNLLYQRRRPKWLLRQVLDRYLPSRLVDRPKMGFGVPIAAWLRGPLRDWADALLSERRLAEGGFLDAGLVRARWREQVSGRRDWQFQLWSVLMFESWRDRWFASG